MRTLNETNLKPEDLHIEYKSAKGGLPKTFWETYSAFANTDGGYIFLGIEESNRQRNASGLTKEKIGDLKTQIFNLLNDKTKISTNLLVDNDIEEAVLNGSYVMIVHVKRCPIELRPVYINSNIYQGTFRRNHDGDYHCSVAEVNAMIRDSNPISSDLLIVDKQEASSLDQESINTYKRIFAFHHPNHPFLRDSDEKFLEFIGALRIDSEGNYHPTMAGLLMFGYSYRIVYELPEFFLDYQEKSKKPEERWNDRLFSDSGEWSGNVFSFFLKVSDRLISNIKTPYRSEGIYRIDDGPIHKAIREALCNALCNADYHLPGGVVIKQQDDSIEFTNPGTLMMEIDRMLKGGDSCPRNKTLLKMFNFINVGERSGSGIPLIFASSKDEQLPLPKIIEDFSPARSTLIFYTKKKEKSGYSLSDLEREIIAFLEANGESKAKEIAAGVKKNVTSVKLCLYGLTDKGLVVSSGAVKSKVYRLP